MPVTDATTDPTRTGSVGNVIRGRVTLTGDDMPLSRVVVAAHDFDPYRLLAGQNDNGPFSGPIWQRLMQWVDSGGALYDFRAVVAETFLVQLLGVAPPEPVLDTLSGLLFPLPNGLTSADGNPDPADPFEVFLDPMWMLGERIGSVIPNSDGWFELEYEQSRLRRGDPDGRPDLLLAVLAPATATSAFARSPRTTASVEDSVFSLPLTGSPFNRLLGITFAGRANVGPQESYLIRVERELAASHGLAPQDPLPVAPTASDIVAAGLRRTNLIRTLRTDPRISTVSPGIRGAGRFVSVAGDMAAIQDTAIAEAVGFAEPIVLPWTATVEMQASWAAMPAATVDDDIIRIDTLSVDPCDVLRGSLGHQLIDRVADLRDYLALEPGPEVPGDEPVPSVETEIDRAIDQKILGALQDPVLAAYELGADNEATNTVERIRTTSAADAVAVHDHNVLRIAYDSIWTEAFDKHLVEDAGAAFDEAVRIHDEAGEAYSPDFSSIEQLAEDLALVDRNYESTTPVPVPRPVRQISPWIDAIVWGALDAGLRLSFAWTAGSLVEDTASGDPEREVFDTELRAAAREVKGSRLTRMMSRVAEQLAEPYAFTYFAPNSWNFGVVLTYRQDWIPQSYQVGDLVASIPMTPGETRKYTTKHVIKTSRKRKEIESRSESTSSEQQVTSRAQAEITRKATQSTSFELSANSSFSFGFGSASVSSAFKTSAAQESASAKKSFREAVRKSAQEYKAERKIEMETETSVSTESETVIEIKNPNNEITVTYLLYELERQFKLRERLHHVQPVIMIARDIPRPDEIDHAWLLRYGWILERVLLDSSFRDALDYLLDGFVGNAVDRSLRETAFDDARAQLKKAEFTLDELVTQRDWLKSMKAMTVLEIIKDEMGEEEYQRWYEENTRLVPGFNPFIGVVPRRRRVQSTAQYRDAARAKSLAADQLKEMDEEALIEKAQGSLTAAQRAYQDAIESWSEVAKLDETKNLAITRLRMHVKDNILYYMHAIWDHEMPDQRYFELADIQVKVHRPSGSIEIATVPGTFDPESRLEHLVARAIGGTSRRPVRITMPPPAPPDPQPLREVADLDEPLGYFGNYAVFPLSTCSYITDYMISSYVDSTFGLRDPDPFGNFSNEELRMLIDRVRSGDLSLTTAEIDELEALIAARLQQPAADFETAVVPTGQLYMEALPGQRSLLEPFKLKHRELDVIQAQESLGHTQIETARRALRLQGDEPDLTDPVDRSHHHPIPGVGSE